MRRAPAGKVLPIGGCKPAHENASVFARCDEVAGRRAKKRGGKVAVSGPKRILLFCLSSRPVRDRAGREDMLRVLSLVCLAAFWAVLSVPCGTVEAASVAAWPAPSQHAPTAAWTPLPDAHVVARGSAEREFEPVVGHSRLVSPQVWERYSRRPVLRGRETVQTPVTPAPKLSPARPARRKPSSGSIVAKPAPKKTTTVAPSKNTPAPTVSPQPVPAKEEPAKTAGAKPDPAPVVSPTPVPTQPAPVVVRKETPPPAPEDNISASWIIRREPAPEQPAPKPVVTPQKQATPPAGENAAGAGTPAQTSSGTPSGV